MTNVRVPARVLAAAVLLLGSGQFAGAQSTGQTQPTRTVFKCKVHGTITYTDEPCLGAVRLDGGPSRGLNKLSGKERIGPDVAHELRREQLDDMIGLSHEQMETNRRRANLGQLTNSECVKLDTALESAERNQRSTDRATLRDLFELRKRYKDLAC